MGSKGWCLLVCLALSGAADAVERQWRAVDVILDCFLMGEGGHRGGFASSENMVKALLVLKQVPVPDDGSLEGLTDFQGGTLAEDDPLITFEASVNLIQIPQAEALLHADCSGKEVTCEISRYFLQARPKATVETAAWFITNVRVSGEGPSISMVMKALGDAENGAVLHPMLKLPLSPQGTVRTEVEFQVTTQTPSLNPLLGSSASLHCGFSMAPGLGITSVEWRLQHKGSGHLVYRWTTGQGQAKREGATLEPQQLLMAGDASLTLPSLTLKDEGTYICEITTSLYRAQQIIQLNVQEAQMASDGVSRRAPDNSIEKFPSPGSCCPALAGCLQSPPSFWTTSKGGAVAKRGEARERPDREACFNRIASDITGL
ncbi:tapasin-related protein isoform X4 [Neophocaena asiaeorientalis asiaeorientalis]|uniref:Tapasin-related protein isoform X4 n=1 Tax=Neophocaena asiaeorientalis asiaeorientalis TaxID=1706337 RepID=A0A341ADX8_NEOAA|nr:tapasin-related protein isoform X4 [Neophocaena asiaeorientalis asiaeorientalis]